MTVLVDTGPLVAYLNRQDPLNPRAVELMDRILAGQHGLPIAIDAVVSEGLTLLGRRPGRLDTSQAFIDWFRPPAGQPPHIQVRYTEPRIFDAARRIHFELYDRRLSHVDCTLLAHARSIDAAIATFDHGMAGLATILPA